MFQLIKYSCFLFTLTLCHLSFAEIYKWTDANGKTHYSDKAPIDGDVESLDEQELTEKSNSYTQAKIEMPIFISASKRKQEKVVMYTSTHCGYCAKAREYLASNGISFKEKNIETSAKYQREFDKIEGKGVPVILWGEKRMNGFSASGFEKRFKHELTKIRS